MTDLAAGEGSRSWRWGLTFLAIGIAVGGLLYVSRNADWSVAWEFSVAQVAVVGGLVLCLCAEKRIRRSDLVFSLVIAALVGGLSLTAIQRFGSAVLLSHAFLPMSLAAGSALLAFFAVCFFKAGRQVFSPDVRKQHGAVFDQTAVAYYRAWYGEVWRSFLMLGAGFCLLGLFWLLLGLFSFVFAAVDVTAFSGLLTEGKFSLPMSCGVVALGIYFTGLRVHSLAANAGPVMPVTAALMPLFLVLALAFLLALAFGGLEAASALGSVAVVLAILAAFGLLFVNSMLRADTSEESATLIIRFSAMALVPCLTVFAVIAVHAVWLRVEQHGLTPERVYAAAVTGLLLIWTSCYAVGLLWRARWTQICRLSNLAGALFLVLVILAVQSPLLDPYRLSAESQRARLVDGRVVPERFDFGYLMFALGQPGRDALARIEEDSGEADARQLAYRIDAVRGAEHQRGRRGSSQASIERKEIRAVLNDPERLQRLPADLTLPHDLGVDELFRLERRIKDCGSQKASECLVVAIDLTEQPGKEYLLVLKFWATKLDMTLIERAGEDEGWWAHRLQHRGNNVELWDALQKGDFEAVAPRHRDLRIGHETIRTFRRSYRTRSQD